MDQKRFPLRSPLRRRIWALRPVFRFLFCRHLVDRLPHRLDVDVDVLLRGSELRVPHDLLDHAGRDLL